MYDIIFAFWLPLDYLLATTRLPRGYQSATTRLPLGYHSAISSYLLATSWLPLTLATRLRPRARALSMKICFIYARRKANFNCTVLWIVKHDDISVTPRSCDMTEFLLPFHHSQPSIILLKTRYVSYQVSNITSMF